MYEARIFVNEPLLILYSSFVMLLTIWVLDSPAATMNMPAMVRTLLFPNPANTASASTQPVTKSATMTPILVNDMGIFLLKKRMIIATKMTRQITIVFTGFSLGNGDSPSALLR